MLIFYFVHTPIGELICLLIQFDTIVPLYFVKCDRFLLCGQFI